MRNEMIELIKSRRSIRKYEPRPIEPQALEAVLEAGTYAPSGRGMQSPVIVAVQDPATIARLSAMNAAILGVSSDPYYGAPAILLVFAPGTAGTAVEDGSCVLENMMLAAHALGLGSCWINRERQMFETEDGKALMAEWGLPPGMIGIAALALGYPDGPTPKAAPRKERYVIQV